MGVAEGLAPVESVGVGLAEVVEERESVEVLEGQAPGVRAAVQLYPEGSRSRPGGFTITEPAADREEGREAARPCRQGSGIALVQLYRLGAGGPGWARYCSIVVCARNRGEGSGATGG